MEIKNVSNIQNFKGNEVKKEQVKQENKNVEIKDGKKKLALAIAGMATIGIAAVAVANKIKKGRAAQVVEGGNEALANIKKLKFEKGVAYNQDGSKFFGTIEDTLENGDKIELVYKDGLIRKSQRTGGKNFTKTFEYDSKDIEKVTTKAGNSERVFVKSADGHEILEGESHEFLRDKKLVKKMYNNKNNIVVNDFDKETGIVKQSINFDKNTKTKEVIKSDALEKLNQVRNRNSKIEKSAIVESGTWESGDLKWAKFEDGTVKEYDTLGRVISEQRPNGEIANRVMINDNAYKLDFPNGDKKIYDECGVLRQEYFADGTYAAYNNDGSLLLESVKIGDDFKTIEYYVSGQAKQKYNELGQSIWYKEDGTMDKFWKDGNHSISYEADGITKRYEDFLDGSHKKYDN